ncbi:double-strand-break repair protein rad21 [Trypanosoma grayi]|uniref:double-strand-break repair protein rad21 n=1 Tax=Trypanosoma grayi TaxID=71804 RepID=UPI0004F4B4F3|nr:double-strand-break repair protein rad21 [Trypanosoma grayi]KEG05481.1 double-strand-break repair protein rad21 [Trypanosoma grayi]
MTTLKRIRDTLVAQQQSPPPPPKRSRKEVVVRDRCTLQEVCHGMHRREAARAFVNVLALASKRVVSVQQPSLAGDVELGLLDVAESLLAAA